MGKPLSLREARLHVAARTVPITQCERVPLAEAHGRFLAEPGVAESLAGRQYAGGLAVGSAIRIMTGACVPAADLVHGTLAELGVRTEFHGIDLKPGKPTYFGTRDVPVGARYVFGLPGNPGSASTAKCWMLRSRVWCLRSAIGCCDVCGGWESCRRQSKAERTMHPRQAN